jgi:hypothetical protein
MTRRSTRSILAAAAAALLTLAGTAQAAVVNKDNSAVSTIPGLTGFATTGAMMTGLSVTATFSNQAAETRLWSTTGANAGGVTGTGWGLSMDGNSFTDFIWEFAINPNANLGQLLSLVIDGAGALTVLDTTFGGLIGTDGSSTGKDFAMDNGFDADATASYSNVVAVTPNAFVGDLYQTLTVTFGGNGGPRSSFRFSQDTDNDSRFRNDVPEPGSLALAGLALAALGAQARRRVARGVQA